MREGTARRAAFGTGLLVFGAVLLFGAVQKRGPATPPVGVAAAALSPDGGAGATVPSYTGVEAAAGQDPVQTADSILALGRRVYQEEGCSACHTIAGVGSPRSPLDGVGGRLTSAEIRLWIVDPQAARPGVRKPAFDDLPADRLAALVTYLLSLRPPDP
jgi:mono/diheme cytochrome c family protein